jgi:hypothetical protein
MTVPQQISPARPADPAVEDELDRLAVMPIAKLRVRYREVFRAEPPKAFGPDLLRRSIAHRIQEKAYGGLSRSAQRLLDQMMKAYSSPQGKRSIFLTDKLSIRRGYSKFETGEKLIPSITVAFSEDF